MSSWLRTALGAWLKATGVRLLRDQAGISLVSQLAGLAIGVGLLGVVTTVFDAAEGVSKKAETATVAIQRAQSGVDLVVNTVTDALAGGSSPLLGNDKVVEVQVPETWEGFKVVRFCLRTGGAQGGALYEQMVYEETIDSSPFLIQGLTSACPDPTWVYNGKASAIAIADRISNYEGSPTHPLFTFVAAPTGGRETLAIDMFVMPPNALRATELTGSATPRLQVGPS